MVSTTAPVSAARLGGILALAERSERFRELAERLEDRRSTKVADAPAGAMVCCISARREETMATGSAAVCARHSVSRR